MSFEDEEDPSILGYKGLKDILHHGFIHIGYKTENAGNSSNRHIADFPFYITCGSHIDIMEHHNAGDVRARVIKVTLSERRFETFALTQCTHTPRVLHKLGLQANIIKHSEHSGRHKKRNCQTNSFYWHRKSNDQFKISQGN